MLKNEYRQLSRCLLCQEVGCTYAGLCEFCLASLPALGESCEVCAGDVPTGERFCGACLAKSPPFDRAVAAYAYSHPVDWLIRRIKYAGAQTYTQVLAELFVRQTASRPMPLDVPECLIPVPLHDNRMRERGFNQALELAKHLAAHFHIAVDWRCVQKIKSGLPQTELSAKLRRRSPRGSFKLNTVPKQRYVAIVDDVMTTGATVEAVAKLLRATPIERIDVWVVARTQTADFI